MTLAKRLQQARQAAGISQTELARRAGCAQQMISKLELGKSARTGDLVSIAAALGVSPEWLFSGDGPGPDAASGVACEPAQYHVTPQLSPQEGVLIEYFRALTERQRADVIRDLQATKQGNDEIFNDMTRRKKA